MWVGAVEDAEVSGVVVSGIGVGIGIGIGVVDGRGDNWSQTNRGSCLRLVKVWFGF